MSLGNVASTRARPRACDFCRKRKIRCDGNGLSDTRCSACLDYGQDCTYVNPTGRHSMREVQELESRIQLMQTLISKHLPDQSRQTVMSGGTPTFNDQTTFGLWTSLDYIWKNKKFEEMFEEFMPKEERINEIDNPAPTDKDFSLPSADPEVDRRYLGEASGWHLVRTADEIKEESIGLRASSIDMLKSTQLESWRESIYRIPEEMSLSQSHSLPSPDLAYKLFEVYFRFIHPFFPIIHRQTFEAQYADGLHKRDPYHAQLVLSVCAVASIYSNDPLVCSTVAGRQVRGMRFIHDILHSGCALGNVNLSMLQAFVLRIVYHQYLGEIHTSWIITGLGIRLAQDIGAHLKSFRDTKNPVEAEMWKRVFWALTAFDWHLGSVIGQPGCVGLEDCELDLPKDLPLEENIIEYFRRSLRLGTLVMTARGMLHPVRTRRHTLFAKVDKGRVIARLDLSRKHWLDELPPHLRWDPDRLDTIHFEQSVKLQAQHHHLIFILHHPVFRFQKEKSEEEIALNLERFRICLEAAVSWSCIAKAFAERSILISSEVNYTTFISGAMLLLGICSPERRGVGPGNETLMTAFSDCLCMFRELEKRWEGIGWAIAKLEYLATIQRSEDSSDGSLRETVTPPLPELHNADLACNSDKVMLPKDVWEPERAYIPPFGMNHGNEDLFGEAWDDGAAPVELGNDFPFDGILFRYSLDE